MSGATQGAGPGDSARADLAGLPAGKLSPRARGHVGLAKEVSETDGAAGEYGVDLDPAAEAFDVAAQRVDEHVAALFQARDGGLCGLELFRKLDLRDFERFAKFAQLHFGQNRVGLFARAPLRRGRHLRYQFAERFVRHLDQSFLLELFQIMRIEFLGLGDGIGIPALRALLTAQKEDGGLPGIEREQDSVGIAAVLDDEFLQVGQLRLFEFADVRSPEVRTFFAKDGDDGGNRYLLALSQTIPPFGEFVGALDLPCHGCNITSRAYKRQDRGAQQIPRGSNRFARSVVLLAL